MTVACQDVQTDTETVEEIKIIVRRTTTCSSGGTWHSRTLDPTEDYSNYQMVGNN